MDIKINMIEIIEELVELEDISYIGEVSDSTCKAMVKESMTKVLNSFIDELENNHEVLQGFLNKLSQKTNRVEVINHNSVIDPTGRVYTNYHCKSVQVQFQDKNKTLKIFI